MLRTAVAVCLVLASALPACRDGAGDDDPVAHPRAETQPATTSPPVPAEPPGRQSPEARHEALRRTPEGTALRTSPDESCPGNELASPRLRLPENAPRGGTLRLAMTQPLDALDILSPRDALVAELHAHVGAHLAWYDFEDHRWRPELAWCIQARDETRRRFTVRLREDARWHPLDERHLAMRPALAGEHPVTADDLAFALELVKQSSAPTLAPMRASLAHVEALRVVDPHTLEVDLSLAEAKPAYSVPQLLVLPRWLLGADAGGEPLTGAALEQAVLAPWYDGMMGSGPYRLLRTDDPERPLRLERFADYFGERPAFDQVEYRLVRQPGDELELLLAGELDVARLTTEQAREQVLDPTPDVGRFSQALNAEGAPADGKLGAGRFPLLAYRFIAWNTRRPALADARVRRAMTHALDREGLVREVHAGLVQPGNTPLHPLYGADAELVPHPYDPAEAARLLDEAGWRDTDEDGVRDKDGQPLRLTLLTYDYRPELLAFADALRASLAPLGVELVVEPLDWPTLSTRMQSGDFDATIGGLLQQRARPPLRATWHRDGHNTASYTHPELDRLVEAVEASSDEDESRALLSQLARHFHDHEPFTVLYYENTLAAWQPTMRNVVMRPAVPVISLLDWYRAPGATP